MPLCKHKDWSLIPRTYINKLGLVVCTCNRILGRQTGGSVGSLASQPSLTGKPQVSVGDHPKTRYMASEEPRQGHSLAFTHVYSSPEIHKRSWHFFWEVLLSMEPRSSRYLPHWALPALSLSRRPLFNLQEAFSLFRTLVKISSGLPIPDKSSEELLQKSQIAKS